MNTEKIFHVCSVTCPNCKNIINIAKKVNIITPAEKAVKEEKYFAENEVQTTLPEEAKP